MNQLLLYLLVNAPFVAISQIPLEQKQSTSYQYYFDRAEELFNLQDYANALTNYNESLILNPLFADAYFSRAIVYEKQHKLDLALIDYNIFVELMPDHYDGRFNRALILFNQQKWAMAKKDFAKLLNMPTGETNAIYFRQDRFSSGVNQVFTAKDNDKAHIYNYLGLIEMEIKEFENALHNFDSAISKSPYNPDYLVNAGLCFESTGDKEKAKVAYLKALALNPEHALAQHNLSILARQEGSDDAELILDEVISTNPDLPFPYAERGFQALNQGKYGQALNDFNKALSLEPSNADYWLHRGMAKEKLRDWVGAYDDYSQTLTIDEKREQAWLYRGNLLYLRGKYEEAVKDYDIAIILHPAYGIAYYNRALAKYRLGNSTGACEDLESAKIYDHKIPGKVLSKICGLQ